ncbi:MAG: hypothetical protein ACRC20_11150 [Segniliparus sp.]|uniref:hypothetical protein n=1 Tax=Segniliparus sp. TaxID=2804064 RepID=UPI003F3E0A54
MRKPTLISAVMFALLQAAGVWVAGAVSAHAFAADNAGSAGTGGANDPADHGSNSSVLTIDGDPVQREDLRPHVSREAEEAADGR